MSASLYFVNGDLVQHKLQLEFVDVHGVWQLYVELRPVSFSLIVVGFCVGRSNVEDVE